MENKIQQNRNLYKQYYSFEKFCELFESEFDKKNGETCDRYYDDFSQKRICPLKFRFSYKGQDLDVIALISKFNGEIVEPKGKYEALRFIIGDTTHFIWRRFRANVHYRFDEKFLKMLEDKNAK